MILCVQFLDDPFGNPGGRTWLAAEDEELKTKPLVDMVTTELATEALRKYSKEAKNGGKPFFIAAG